MDMMSNRKPPAPHRFSVGNRPFRPRFLVHMLLVSLCVLVCMGASHVSALDYDQIVQPTGDPYRGHLKNLDAQGDQGPLLTPPEANTLSALRGYTLPPWDTGTRVTLIRNTTTLYFARFFTPPGSNQYGSWVMRAATIRGLSAAQIKDAFALEKVPTGVAYAVVPAGHVLWTGIAGPILGPGHDWGSGGGEQTFIDDSRAGPSIVFYWKDLTGGALLYAPVAGGGNAGKTAAYLDGIIPADYRDRITASAYSSLDPYLGPLDVLSFGGRDAFDAALNQVGPERYDAMTRVSVRTDILFGRAISRRNQPAPPSGQASSAHPGDADSPSSRAALFGTNGIRFWAEGLGEFGRQAGSGEHTGFGYSTGGVVMGADLLAAGNFTLGAAAGYLRTNLDWTNNGGDAGIDSPRFGVYCDYTAPAGFFAKGLVAGGYNGGSATRNITYPGVNQSADADTSGLDMMLQVSGGYEFRVSEWSVSPVAELSYFFLHQDGFTENGADSLNLDVRSREDQTFRSRLGLRVEREFIAGTGIPVTPSAELGWAHEIPLNGRSITASLVNQPGTFSVNGVTGDTDALTVEAGLKARFGRNTLLYTGYEAEVGNHFTAHQVGVGLQYSF